ncbi:metal-dependent hydrolase [Candidatus Micrarchaeota archaeon]|nr:metal-dependent hydrolase [Candidatus Micrarchaeota archaeon]
MDWKSHATIGILLTLITFIYFFQVTNIIQLLPLVLFAGFSALLPDLDHKMSKGKEILDGVIIIFAIIIAFVNNSIILFFALIGLYFLFFTILKPKHRGVTHSILFTLVYAALIYFLISLNFAIAGFIGYLSHLIADRELKLF